MSRVGKRPIVVPEGVKVELGRDLITVRGPKGEISKEILGIVSSKLEDNTLSFEVKEDSKFARSYYGTIRQIVGNMIEGVNKGFEKKLQLVGIGYKAIPSEGGLNLSLAYSHPVRIEPVDGITFRVDASTIIVSGIDKEKVGLVAADIKRKRKPDAYKGKGIRYEGEKIKLKEGKKKSK